MEDTTTSNGKPDSPGAPPLSPEPWVRASTSGVKVVMWLRRDLMGTLLPPRWWEPHHLALQSGYERLSLDRMFPRLYRLFKIRRVAE